MQAISFHSWVELAAMFYTRASLTNVFMMVFAQKTTTIHQSIMWDQQLNALCDQLAKPCVVIPAQKLVHINLYVLQLMTAQERCPLLEGIAWVSWGGSNPKVTREQYAPKKKVGEVIKSNKNQGALFVQWVNSMCHVAFYQMKIYKKVWFSILL